jgi:hypothetical protein
MRMIPNQGEERRLRAEHIGHVVLISAQLDAAIIRCVTAATGDQMAAFGMSGKQLGKKCARLRSSLRFTTGCSAR